nr:hypothetical protein [Tanacetum cinerariifolium]
EATKFVGDFKSLANEADASLAKHKALELEIERLLKAVELALMCDRMFLEELAKVERYVGGLLEMIHSGVKASKPQSMQEAIEFATELMDKKMLTHVQCQAEHKRKFDSTLRNNQNQK